MNRQNLACMRMLKNQKGGMQSLSPAEPFDPGRFLAKERRVQGRRTIERIAKQSMAAGGQVHTDLVGTARLQFA